MVKRQHNVFGDSDGDDSDKEETSKRIVPKKVKQVPLWLQKGTDELESGSGQEEKSSNEDEDRSLKSDPESDSEDPDYMKFSVLEAPSKQTPNLQGLKYEEVQRLTRDEALNTSLFESQSSSIGLAMMKKMGFKVGDTLGKTKDTTEQKQSVPIDVQVKSDRTGIGAKHVLSEVVSVSSDGEEFLERNSNKSKEDSLIRTLNKLKKVCFEMSGESEKYYEDRDLSAINALWRDYPVNQLKAEEAKTAKKRKVSTPKNDLSSHKHESRDDIIDDDDLLTLLLLYLREKHYFCYFCGAKYENQEDLNKYCPGIYEDSHLNR